MKEYAGIESYHSVRLRQFINPIHATGLFQYPVKT